MKPGDPKRLLQIHDLKTSFKMEDGKARAVDGVSFHINHGETTAIVGESGCGKSVTLLSILRLIQSPGSIDGGKIYFEDIDLLALSEKDMRDIRGNEIAMIFQEPMTSLNPVIKIGDQIIEAINLHRKVGTGEAQKTAVEMLRRVGIPDPHRRVKDYPHQMSGGMRQRVMIAIALSCNPKLLLADEPTTALDGTIQAQFIDLVRQLKKDMGMAVVWVTHDLGVVAEIAQRAIVMYAGKVVEEGDVFSLFKSPIHPYTEGLLKSIPRLDKDVDRLHVVDGFVPDPKNYPNGCRFHPRCRIAVEACREFEPPLHKFDSDRFAACHLSEKRIRDRNEIRPEDGVFSSKENSH